MNRYGLAALLLLSNPGLLAGADEGVVFRSDVSLVRVDAQVLDRDNRAISGLRIEDFVLRENGKPVQIRNFAREDMPVDVLLLFDVSASMRPHVQRIASAAHSALNVLTDNDRVGIMVFDRSTRVRLTLRNGRSEVERELENMLRQETFRGGTDITRALLDAAAYIGRSGRKDARRAIVILTDDQTEFERDEAGVGRALQRADAVLSALIAPDAMGSGQMGGMGRRGGGNSGGGWPGNGGGSTWPGSGGGIGFPGGGIGFPRRGGGYGGRNGGGNYPGSGGGGRTKSAGTSEIARDSGGDSLPVDDAEALETTLSRIRQRYALHFLLPPGVRAGQERTIEVALSDSGRRRYPDADVRYRRSYIAASGTADAEPGVSTPTVVTGNRPPETNDANSDTSSNSRRRRAISEPEGPRGINPTVGEVGTPAAQQPPDPPSGDPPKGWRKLKPGEQP